MFRFTSVILCVTRVSLCMCSWKPDGKTFYRFAIVALCVTTRHSADDTCVHCMMGATNSETRNIWLIVWEWFCTIHFLSNFIPFPFKDAPTCFPLVWPWRQCNPRARRLMLFLLFPPVFVFLRSTKRLRLLFMLSSRWPKPCLHCSRCSIISSDVSSKITFFADSITK